MQLPELAQSMGLDAADPRLAKLGRRLAGPGRTLEGWDALAVALARSLMPAAGASVPWPAWDAAAPLVVGIAGAQGAGKSTLAGRLEQALLAAGARAVACSLDDFYLSRARRRELARSVHALLATRGVPGTHDVALLRRTVAALGGRGQVALPGFDKGADDVLPAARWRRVRAPVDVVVLDGWCLGARAQPESVLLRAVNDLEAREDPDGTWRRYVNDALAGPYAALWRCLHALIYLEVPGMAAVLRWRGQQERALPPEQRMSANALRRFVAHYERITLAMQADLPATADLTVHLDGHHAIAGIRVNMLPLQRA